MTADNEQVTSTDASAHAASQLRRGANSTSRVEPGTGLVTGVNGRGSSVPAVRVEGVVKRFGATVALDGAGLEIPAGMVFGLLGPNGAGKTTLDRRPAGRLHTPVRMALPADQLSRVPLLKILITSASPGGSMVQWGG